jgi:hypothetical protein
MKNLKKIIALSVSGIALASTLTGCFPSGGTSTAQCAYIVGNGQDDRKIHSIVVPGNKLPTPNREEIQYVPCGPRNYIINDGQQKNSNGDTVGDSFQVVQVWTKAAEGDPRVQLNISLKADWTLNESEKALRGFYPLCYKYTCYNTDSSKANDSNFSTTGWNGMLSENFDPAIRTVAINEVSSKFTKKELDDPANWSKLGDALSNAFGPEIKRATGITDTDLFCGSGSTSGFSDDNKEFNCGNVRFTINKVEATNDNVRDADNQRAEQEATAAQADAIIANAKKKYGDDWSYFLGLQDTIEKCKSADKVTCVVNLGGGQVSVPTP